MGNATSYALAAAQERLLADQSVASSDFAVELFEASRTIDSVSRFAHLLADPSTAAQQRVEVAKAVFDGKLSPAVESVLLAAVSDRWSNANELVSSLGVLAVDALGLSAHDQISVLLDELFVVQRLFSTSADLQLDLRAPITDLEAAQALASKLVADDTLPETRQLVAFALTAHRGSEMRSALAETAQEIARLTGQRIGLVRTAIPLNSDQLQSISARLQSESGTPVHLDVMTDRSLVGGVTVEFGSRLLDASVSTKLDDLRARLAHA